MQFLTRIDLYEQGRQFVLSRARRINPRMVDVQGSDINIYVGSASFMAQMVVRQMAERLNALLLDGCEGEDVDRYAWDRYQERRKGASPALVTVRFFRPSFAAGVGTISKGTRMLSLGGIEYVTLVDATFGATQVDGVTAMAQSTQAGKAFEVGTNQIRRFVNTTALFDASMQVTNDEVAAGGEDREDDDTFKERLRGFWTSARRGTLTAIAFGATQVAGVVSAEAVEALTDDAIPARVVELFFADSSGVASAALGTSVIRELEEWRAGGIAVLPRTSQPQIVPVQLHLTFRGGVDTVSLSNQIKTAVMNFINSLGVNRPLYRNDLGAVLSRFKINGLLPDENTVASPTGDVVPDPGKSLRTTVSDVTVV